MQRCKQCIACSDESSCPPGGDENVVECNVCTDQHLITLEINKESSKNTEDSEPTTLYNLFFEMEKEGLVGVSLHGHECARPDGAMAADKDCFHVKAKGDSKLVFKYQNLGASVKHTNAAGYFKYKQLAASKELVMSWRVVLDQDNMQLVPKKPLWYLRRPLQLEAGAAMRLA